MTPNPAVVVYRAASFELGRTLATPGVLAEVSELEIALFMARHHSGDWGTLDAEDKAANDAALIHGDRLLSAYHASNGTKVWIITEADRSSTTVLLPSEY